MPITLTIENETNLPDGGPVTLTVSGRRNVDIGRDSHLDWTLPDPTRHISSKHCEIRYNEGGYWLHDVSSNGTFLNGSDHRMQAPHRLRSGDRFAVGHYIIGARVEGEEAAASPGAAVAPAAPNYQEIWAAENVAPPIDRAMLKPKKELQSVNRDFLDWAADVPDAAPAPSSPFDTPVRAAPPSPFDPPARPAAPPSPFDQPVRPTPPSPFEPAARSPFDLPAADPDTGWATGPRTPQPPPPEPPPAMPTPRRPVWVAAEPDGPWGGEPNGQKGAKSPAPAEPRAAAASESERAPAPRAPAASSATALPLAQLLAQGARVPEEFFAGRSPEELAELFGQVMRLVVENTMQLLNARVQAKRLARSSSHTMIEALNNNPLKFSPTAEEAMRIMFGPATRSYLDAYRAFAQSFDDLKTHQIKTYSAMQHALIKLMNDLDPQTIEREAGEDRGIAALVTSRKAKLWDAYMARWQAKTRRETGGMIDSFMLSFAEYYDRDGNETQ